MIVTSGSLNDVVLRGHQLNVSWAVVQRSSGFLDGADRAVDSFNEPTSAMKKPNRSSQITPKGTTFSSVSQIQPHSFGSTHPVEDKNDPGKHFARDFDFGFGNLGTAFASTLLVSNLCPWLFQSHIDIHSLFAPYGYVKKIIIIPPVPNPALPKNQQPHAALVEYDDIQNALSALYQVNGRPFGTCIAKASLFRDAMQRAMLIQNAQDPIINNGRINQASAHSDQIHSENAKSPVMKKPTDYSPRAPRLNVH